MGDVVTLIERKELSADCLLVKETEHMCEVHLQLHSLSVPRFTLHERRVTISELAIAANALMNHAG
jgi:hypothetical protein